jgi:membrane-bound serine protease (ClpP class)
LGVGALRRPPTTGSQGLAGEEGVAVTDLRPEGQVKVRGEIWNAVTSGEGIPRGDAVVVERSRDLRLIVHRKTTT